MADIDFSSMLNTYNAVGSGDPTAITGAASSLPGGIGGLGEGVTIGEAVSGDPAAILKLVQNPAAAAQFLLQYNPIAVGGDIASIFSANGVGPDFFSKFPFLNFLDNSTGHWKSRQPALRAMTPVQRLSWYINGFNTGGFTYSDANQYQEFFGAHGLDKNHKVSNDEPNLPYQLAQTWNSILLEKIFKGQPTFSFDDGNGHHVVKQSDFFIDVTKTQDYAQVLAQLQAQAQAQYNASLTPQGLQSSISSNSKTLLIFGILFGVLILAIGIYLITRKK